MLFSVYFKAEIMHKNAILLAGQQHTIDEVILHIIMIKGFRKKHKFTQTHISVSANLRVNLRDVYSRFPSVGINLISWQNSH